MNSRLKELIENGMLDWENLQHREMYLKFWVNQLPTQEEEESSVDDG